ncbi:MAG TPA: hypothetical protein PK413_20155, partial [Thermoanaerobaculia bacterium]|nr:hypothetical protein [Thermoanaerobaculia bacterium]
SGTLAGAQNKPPIDLPDTAYPGCNPYNAGPMEDLASVLVEARPARVTEAEAWTNCCWYCGEQSLGALRPTPNGPEKLESDGGLPLRRRLCGTVERYGVNDENADPRDIMINIVPKAGFEHLVAGFVNTECTPLSSAEKNLFAKSDAKCPVSSCLAAAAAKTGKCIHAEITPAQQLYGRDASFLPIADGGGCGDGWGCRSALEPASEWGTSPPPPGGVPSQPGREACVFGVYAIDHGPDHRVKDHSQLCCSLDASHDRPEIHPLDAIWFRHPEARQGWIFALLQDDSNRYSFPHCGDNNGNTWSQGARDLTFYFPFQFPRAQAPRKACLRRHRAIDFQGAEAEIRPVNITTSVVDNPLTELKKLEDGGQLLLEVFEQAGAEDDA